MAKNPRVLREYFTPNTYNSPIGNRLPEIEANHFEIKAFTIQMLPFFYGLDYENPYKHIDEFLEICSIFKLPNVSDDAIRLRIFPFSLKDKAKHWLHTRERIDTWTEMSREFLKKYFPMGKLTRLRREITTFSQQNNEQFHEKNLICNENVNSNFACIGPPENSSLIVNHEDFEELKKGKGSDTIERRNPNIGEEYYNGYYNGQQGDKLLDKIKWKVPSFKGETDPNVNTYTFEKDGKKLMLNPLTPTQVFEEQKKMREKERFESGKKRKSIEEGKRIEEK
ncbi:hypothetical protein M9H77_26713 [Catharanthus roseus]|uniref:Uncharacterized protein n=1 Tax=Catharanthus roseus TaxID=4058 RepID=A0ACC0ACC1_CATRO|nr:hypothetical protein M9H77_26713 [Catharanthus roseus]